MLRCSFRIAAIHDERRGIHDRIPAEPEKTVITIESSIRYVTGRNLVSRGEEAAVESFKSGVQPFSIFGLLVTVVPLFGFQGEVILGHSLVIALIAVPLLIQSFGIFFAACGATRAWRIPFNVAAPCALIGTSNFFELAVAVAIGLFGLGSAAALATVVGVLVEAPVMLSLVAFANRTKHWFPTEPDVS